MTDTTVKTIDITPTWASLLNALLLVYTEGNPTGRSNAIDELRRMAAAADLAVGYSKQVARLNDVLARNLDAWEDEEDSVKEEHEQLIEDTRAAILVGV